MVFIPYVEKMHGTKSLKVVFHWRWVGSTVSQTVFLADSFWLRKILAFLLTQILCPDDRYPKLKIYIAELIFRWLGIHNSASLYRHWGSVQAQWPRQSIVTKTGHNTQSMRTERHRYWTNGCVNSCTNSPEDGPVCIQSTRTERHRYWTNGCVNSCTNSPEDGPVCPKHVEIRQYTNKIETVTSVGLYSICWPSYTSPGVSHPVTADIALCTQDNVPLHYTYLLWLLTCFIPIGLRIV